MNQKNILLLSPLMQGKEQSYIAQAFHNNCIAPVTFHVDLFENLLTTFLVDEVKVIPIQQPNVTSLLALQLAVFHKNDFVFCQCVTFIASVNPLMYLRSQPIKENDLYCNQSQIRYN